MIRLHPAGYKIIIIYAVLFLFLNTLSYYFLFNNVQYLFMLLLIITLLAFVILINFFRRPNRKLFYINDVVFSPADGKIVAIEEVNEPEFFKEKKKLLSIFMSPLNVHVNWYPINGKVKYFKYHPGKYRVAFHPKSSTENERTSIVIEDARKNIILFRQIAGTVAKRIVCYAKTGDTVNAGEECGIIKFGSRVDIFLPLSSKINVQLHEKVKGVKTILAYL